MSNIFLQDPDEKLDYAADFTAWLEGGDVISSATWAIDPPAGVTLDDQADDFTPGTDKSSIFVSGLVRGNVYVLTCSAVTTGGRTPDRSMSIRCGRR